MLQTSPRAPTTCRDTIEDVRGRYFAPDTRVSPGRTPPDKRRFAGARAAREAIFGDFGRFLTLDTHVSLPFGHPPAPPVSPCPDENLLVGGLVVGIQGAEPLGD